MNPIIYIVTGSHDYEGTDILGVFDRRDLAQGYLARKRNSDRKQGYTYDSYGVQEYTVNIGESYD